MIGIALVTHGRLGEALIDTAEFILGRRIEAIVPVSIDLTQKPDSMREKIKKSIKPIKKDDGVLLLTDMFGGTPSNISCSFLSEGHIEVLCGVNLPMLIKAVNAREKMALPELASVLESYGKKSISCAGGILKNDQQN